MNDNKLNTRIEAIEKLITIFKLERMVHLVITSISATILLICAIILIFKKDFVTLVPILGSSGFLVYSVNRLLHMWDQAFQMLFSIQDEQD